MEVVESGALNRECSTTKRSGVFSVAQTLTKKDKNMFRSSRCVLLLLVAPAIGMSQSATSKADQKAVPVYEEPNHHVVFKNQFVRVLDVHIPPGKATGFHIHANPLTGVTIHDEPSWEEVMGRDRNPKQKPEVAGEVFDNWTRKRPYTHRVGNVGKSEIHYVATEWLSASGVTSEPLRDSATRKMVKEGQYVRVYRITLAPGESSEPHTHVSPGLTVQAFDGEFEDSGAKTGSSGGNGAGAWKWHEAGYQHTLRNPGSKPMEVVEMDWR